jgi:hypothetical protein
MENVKPELDHILFTKNQIAFFKQLLVTYEQNMIGMEGIAEFDVSGVSGRTNDGNYVYFELSQEAFDMMQSMHLHHTVKVLNDVHFSISKLLDETELE